MRHFTRLHFWVGAAVVVALALPAMAADAPQPVTVVSEDWESVASLPSTDWATFVRGGSTYAFIENAGNPGRCLNAGGGGHEQDAFTYLKSFRADFAQGMTIAWQSYLQSGSQHYTDTFVGLIGGVTPPESLLPGWPVHAVYLNFQNSGGARNVNCGLNSPDTAHQEGYSLPGGYPGGQWVDGKIVIRPDQLVEFHVNGAIIWTSTKTIDPAWCGNSLLFVRGQVAGGPARVDNIVVSVPATDPTNTAPQQPTNVSPPPGQAGVPVTPTLVASAFVDPDTTDTHGASQWQVRAEGAPTDYSSPAFDSGVSASALTSVTLPAAALSGSSSYAWRVRYRDNRGAWSPWSAETLFTTELVFSTRETPVWTPVNLGYLNGKLAAIHERNWGGKLTAFGDIDGDGDLDCLAGAMFNLRYLRNDGTRSAPIYTRVSERAIDHRQDSMTTRYPCLVDLDDDGLLDLIVAFGARNGPNQVVLFKNTGSKDSPVWTKTVDNLLPSLGGDIAIPTFLDLDADGDLDLLMGRDWAWYADSSPRKVTAFINNRTTTGTWNFVAKPEWDIALPSSVMMAAPEYDDLDGDGDLDILVSYQMQPMQFYGSIAYFENAGSPTAPSWAAGDFGRLFHIYNALNWRGARMVDYDGDGDRDILMVWGTDSAYYERSTQAGQAVFTKSESMFSTVKSNAGNDAHGDIDGDGDNDIAFVDNAEQTVKWVENEGSVATPRWRNEKVLCGLPTDIIYETNSCPALVDIDGDGDNDMFVSACKWDDGPQPDSHRFYFYRNTGGGNFVLEDADYRPTGARNWFELAHIAFCDIDADGDQDLFVGTFTASGYGLNFIFYENTSQNPHALPAYNQWVAHDNYLMGLPAGEGTTMAPAFGDVDRDGDLDLVIARGGTATGDWAYLNYFENTGTARNAVWAAGIQSWIPDAIPIHWANLPSLVDIDDDGDLDLFFSDSAGCLPFYRNDAPKIRVEPRLFTLVAGSSVTLSCPEDPTITSWTLISNRSGASLAANGQAAVYTAGSTTATVDVVEVTNAAGTRGRAHINVVGADQVGATGKAVVIAGRQSASDGLWPTTDNLAHFVYRMLRARGFSKQDIAYLSPVPGRDVDGDGTNDMVGASSVASAQDALTNFAQGAPSLFVYLVDHGDADDSGANGFFQLNGGETLSAAQLDGWLDALQAGAGATTVTLVVDCCQSGSFLPACAGAPAGKARVVVASSGALQPSVFSGGGLISFTNAFVGALASGLDVGHAFDLGAGAMDRCQQAVMDDNGDGRYDRDFDGAVARAVRIGPAFIAGADRPQVAAVSPNRTLTAGSSAAVWASGVAGPYPVERVWATIASPDLLPGAQLQPNQPVTALPELELTWSPANQRYEATANSFAQLGVHAVNIYARDIWGGVSYPKQVYVNQTVSSERMIVVCGRGAFDSNSPWVWSHYLSKLAHETALARWLTPAEVIWLSDPGDPAVDGPATLSALDAARVSVTGSGKLSLYLVGNGNAGAFDLDGDGVAADPDDLTPALLKRGLDMLQSQGGVTTVTVVLDFSGSGAWIPQLVPAPSGKSRIVLASARAGEMAWCEQGGTLSFSQALFSWVLQGRNLRDAFNEARNAVRAFTNNAQLPQLEDDGSGIPNWQDGALAARTHIGAAFVTGVGEPRIGSFADGVLLPTDTAVLWAADVTAPDGVSEVFALVVKPSAGPTNDQIQRVDLEYNPTAGRWEASCDGFAAGQNHPVVYFARDRNGALSPPHSALFGGNPPAAVADWSLY